MTNAAEASVWKRFWDAHGLGAVSLAAVFYAGIAIMDLWPLDPIPYRQGQYLRSNIFARVPFKAPNREQLAKQQALINAQSTFVLNATLINSIVSPVRLLPESLKAATQSADVPEDVLARFGLDKETLEAWREYTNPDDIKEFDRQVASMRDALTQTVIVAADDAKDQRSRLQFFNAEFLVSYDNTTAGRPIADMIATDEVPRITQACDKIADKFSSQLVRVSVRKYLTSVLIPPPRPGGTKMGEATYVKDAALTDINRQKALAALDANPPQIDYAEGDLLVTGSRLTGRRRDAFLTADNMPLLRREHIQYVHDEQEYRPFMYWGKALGRMTVLLLITILLCMYIVRLRRDLVADHVRCAGMVGVLLAMALLVKVAGSVAGWNSQVVAILPVLMAAVILTIAFNQRLAWTACTIFSLLMTLQLRGGLDTFIVFLVAVTVAIFQLRDIRTRTRLPIIATVTAGIVVVIMAATGILSGLPARTVAQYSLLGGAAAFLVCLVQVMLPLIEKVFGIATSMTLLEYADASKPVLKRLALEAPGTYNHSLQLGALCEAAAESIGANGLLARVGAYYHDIGKINKPDYFVENQAGSPSKHQNLSPAMSLLIIIGHVKDGVELARQYGLPRVLHEFIASHHGTTLVQHFYQAATEQRRADTDRAPDEVEFRYQGPKPKSPEAAILMLADATESSVRSMGEPTAGRIENQVHTMISRRLMDGQLDDCELTLRQVHTIETSLIKSLTSMYHIRVPYPTPAGQAASASELMAARKQEEKATAEGTVDKTAT